MKVLLVNSSPHEKGCVFTALDHLAQRLNTHGIETEIFSFGHTPVSGCIACGACRKTGKCFKNDLVNEFAAKCETADGFVFGTPVYYAGPSGQLISFMDRLFYSAGRFLQNKPACAVVSCRRGGASAAFESINKYFQISNMPVVSSQYWNQVHGSCAGRCAEGRRRLADHAHTCRQHGVFTSLHRGRKGYRNNRAGARGIPAHQFHPVI